MRNLFLLIIVWIASQSMALAQEAVTDSILPIRNDSIDTSKLQTTPIQQEESVSMELQLLDPELQFTEEANRLRVEPAMTEYKPNFDTRYIPPKSTYYEDAFIRITPFNFGFDNGYQGGWMGGVNSYLPLSDNFWMNVRTYASSSYYGPFYPQRYNNATLAFDMKLQVHERIRLVGFGEISLREGMNPALAPLINGGYNFGGGVEIKVAKNFGIGFGVVNSYYRKSWTTQPYVGPVAW